MNLEYLSIYLGFLPFLSNNIFYFSVYLCLTFVLPWLSCYRIEGVRCEKGSWLGGGPVGWSIIPYTKSHGFNLQSGTYLGCRFDPKLQYIWEVTD